MNKTVLSILAVLLVVFPHHPIAAASPGKSDASEPRKLSEKQARALAVYAPRPPYPSFARARGITGTGIVILSVDPNGEVTATQMGVSTGHRFLDDVALAAFRKWRFKPGTVSHVRIPITFCLHWLYVRTSGDRSWLQSVTNWSLPYYPRDAVHKGLTGSGVAVMKIDSTGSVSSTAMLKSTGQKILDAAALQAFRQWHFKPGTLTQLDIPIEFKRAAPGAD